MDGAMWLLVAAVVVLHWRAASVMLGGGLVADEAKHYTSGAMAYEYLRHGMATNPLRFAESFEVQYPLVAIGQWPPMYYAVQAAFYLVAGPTIRSAQVLSALLAAGLAGGIFLCLRRATGWRIALLAAAVFLAMPTMQQAAWEVMSDLLTGCFVFGAVVAFARLLEEPQNWRAALGFAACGVAAIFTKGSAWALGPFVLIAPVLAGRLGYFRSRWFWVPGSAVALLGATFYLYSQRAGIGYHANIGHLLSTQVGFGRRAEMLGVDLTFAPNGLKLLGVVVLAGAVARRWRRGDVSPGTTLTLAAGAWFAAQVVFLFVLPLTWEPRVFVPSLAPLAVLAARAMVWARDALAERPLLASAAPVLVGVLLLAEAGAAPLDRLVGYARAADAMPYPAEGALILVATDRDGEGPMITERLSRSATKRDVILRGTHVLADIDNQHRETLRIASAEAVRSYLLGMPVRFVVLSSPPFRYSYQALVEAAVTGDPKDFQLVATVPIVHRSGGSADAVRIYENPAGRDRHPEVVRTPLGSYAGGRVVEYRWK
jgi:4-amino-4-deoxy-L-arabinose transferase-like glycosyltransferase